MSKRLVQRVLRPFGIQVKRYPDADLVRRMKIVRNCEIDTLLDVGANEGQYGLEMRRLGYSGRIVSFEPMLNPYRKLESIATARGPWEAIQAALGDEAGYMDINVSANSHSSSLLSAMPQLREWAPRAAFVRKENVAVHVLDEEFDALCPPGSRVMLKLDVQGYEDKVLAGAVSSLPRIALLQMEMSVTPLYEGERTFKDFLAALSDKGFELYSLENGFADEATGRLLQVDGIFVNTRSAG